MAFVSAAELLVLHGVRIQGMADTGSIARRFSLGQDVVSDLLLDHEAHGWVRRVGFADISGWTLTEAGRDQDSRLVAAELEESGARESVAASYAAFIRLNARFLDRITRWQIRPTTWDAMARNDHSDWGWDENVLQDLAGLSRSLRPLGDQLAAAMARLAGYPERFDAALRRVDLGERKWVDEPRIDSCHTVWFELHEDLLATLGLARGDGA